MVTGKLTAGDSGGESSNGGTPALAAPVISLPKGGGAIRGIGEKFGANPVTGTASMTIPIATSPGRSGFGPQLSLSYDSGGGNGPFGLGWSLALPAITRKTEQELPRYDDGAESDTFILSGSEDLVRSLRQDGAGDWELNAHTRDGFRIQRYRPRIEGLFARIERWTRESDGDTYWRAITRENVTTFYGRTPESRIADPADPSRVFSWLICSSYDDKGNAILYEYVPEDSDRIFEDANGHSSALAHERNRSDLTRGANRYIKRIRYGNRTPNRDAAGNAIDPATLNEWLFDVVFDYGDGHYADAPAVNDQEFAVVTMTAAAGVHWPVRQDSFSSFRSGFDIRTYRLCHRVLMFHHFPDELGRSDYLVRSTAFDYRQNPVASVLAKVTESGYLLEATPAAPDQYRKQSLPPVELEYSQVPSPAELALQPVESVDPGSLENLPVGLDGGSYQWVDLDGEGSSGILTEQGSAWFYKRNSSASNLVPNPADGDQVAARFDPVEIIARTPAVGLKGPRTQLLDLAGDGQVDLVQVGGAMPGFYERTVDADWSPFRPFTSIPTLDTGDPDLRFIDLNGDGLADILVTEGEALTWYPSLGEDGFGPAQRITTNLGEELGPRLVFNDGTGSVYLADLSGDGSADLVRIRNGDVSYWPNLGHGRFGARVAMDDAPVFDAPDQFDQRRIRLADIDGSGVTDIIYFGADGVRIYLNHAGNAWSEAVPVPQFPAVDAATDVQALDLLGSGTACLVWSSPRPDQSGHVMRYVELMGGQKPHLLLRMINNLGTETRMAYAPSTRFYLQDKQDGKPWITRLPFPVHVVERVELIDHISGNRFVTRNAYHHGYFDGEEREFRGFGMVEQWDTEQFNALTAGGAAAGATNLDAASHVPPILTRTWFHTGASMGRNHVSDYFSGLLDGIDQGEYYREPNLTDDEARKRLLPDTVLMSETAVDEEHEACRALKGSMLRQEVYAQDGTDKAGVPYTVTEQNFTVRQVQPREGNNYAVFFTHSREAITYQYERNPTDPRVSHALTLEVDPYGNVRRSLAVGYGRRQSSLPDARDREKQTTALITYTDSRFTNPIDDHVRYPDDHRSPLQAEIRTYELTGFTPQHGAMRFSFDEWARNDFALAVSATEIPYEITATGATKQKRLIEHIRTLYRADDLTTFLPTGGMEPLALPGETYKLALTAGLMAHVYRRKQATESDEALVPNPGPLLEGKGADGGGYVVMDGGWWVPSGRVFFDPAADVANPALTAAQELLTARQHFFLLRKITDPFDHVAVMEYDGPTNPAAPRHDLLVIRSSDALGNTVTAVNDYRVLQPSLLTDPNRNRSAAIFDALGLVIATAIMGKTSEMLGDLPEGVDPDPPLADVQAFIADPIAEAASLLGKTTTRIVYDMGRFQRTGQPPFAATLTRETHVHELAGAPANIQISISYSDGFGREIQKKVQAEPGSAPQREANILQRSGDTRPGNLVRDSQGRLVQANAARRWVGSGRTVFNSKGKPVRQYEPFFSPTHLYESEDDMIDSGATPVLFYDPIERIVATLHPNHTYEKVVFGPWQQLTYDVNDTVAANGTETGDPRTDPDIAGYVREYFKTQPAGWEPWHTSRIGNQMEAAEHDAAQKAEAHANTPIVAHFDVLGHPFLTIAHNRYARDGVVTNEQNATRIEIDLEGNHRSITDAQNRIVMRYDYDLLGNRIHLASMEAGERWMLNDAVGNPIRSWDSRRFLRRMTYDELRRPTGLYVIENGVERLAEHTVYGEGQGDVANHRTHIKQVFDQAGIVTHVAYDFKGNLVEDRRDLLPTYTRGVDWLQNPAADDGAFASRTTYDALNRPRTIRSPDGSVYRPIYNEANLLDKVGVSLRGAATVTPFVTNIDYDAKGQRERIVYGNGAQTTYAYDPQTFRLVHMKTSRAAIGDATASKLFRDPTIVQDLHYTYDPVGNITRLEDAALKRITHNGQQVDPVCAYTYDATYRLTDARGREHIGQNAFAFTPEQDNFRDYPFIGHRDHPNNPEAMRNFTQRYEYDTVGNIRVVRHLANGGGWTRRYTYDETSLIEAGKKSNRLTKTTTGNGSAVSEAYRYADSQGSDVHGCTTAINTMEIIWDFKDQLERVDLVGGGTAYYVYDLSGQRTRKVIESQTGKRRKERITLGGFEIYREYNGSGKKVMLERESLHVMDDAQRIALVESQTVRSGNTVNAPVSLQRYQLGNHLGSANMELADDCALITYEEYHPYGTTAFQTGRSIVEVRLKRYRYTGKERDEETGFSYHGARYYAPWLGRWQSPDPLFLKDATNVYLYALNNPIVAKDPTGGPAWFIPVVVYLGYKALTSAAETGVEAGIAKATGDESFSAGGTFAKNMVVNSTIGLIPGTSEAKVAVKVGVYGSKLALRTTADATLDTVQGRGDFSENFVKSGLGNAGGDLLGAGVKKVAEKTDVVSKTKQLFTKPTTTSKAPGEVDAALGQTFSGGQNEGIFQTTSRLARGNLGERLATESLATQGHAILSFKPSILGTNQGGIDIVTIRNGVVHLIDNKALSRSGNVSSVSALTTNYAQNLKAVRQELSNALLQPNISSSETALLNQAIQSINSGNVVRAVTNANLAPDDKILSGVTQNLQNQGIQFLNVY